MFDTSNNALAETIHAAAVPLRGADQDYDALLDLIGDARFVLLGEASHGTHEFYRERARITRRLMREKGFCAVAVEADWPDASRVNAFVRGASEDTALQSLDNFKRFPGWMWRNTDVLEFVGWLRAENQRLGVDGGALGFYGLDLYSLYGSIEAVLDYLTKIDPDAARNARSRYSCFEHFGEDTQAYGYAASFGMSPSCEDEVVNQLLELQRNAAEYAGRDGQTAEDTYFFAEQNARLVKNAEQYYRTMFSGRVSSWNLRDQHMADTLEALVAHLERHNEQAKVVLWEHNSHLGDARATDMAQQGELNVGQIVRERHGGDAVLVGFSTYSGTVTAASDWDAPPERKRVRPGMAGSYEALFHAVSERGLGAERAAGATSAAEPARDFMVFPRAGGPLADALRPPRLERAIGVVYRPETERLSHYFHARMADQFDAVLHLDQTQAVEPLERTAGWEAGEPPETFPTGM